jgi:hypothetical protein
VVAVERVVAVLILLVLGFISLPAVAGVLDGQGSENLIVPVQLALMAAAGALAGRLVPALGGTGASRRRGIVVGALLGVAAALVGVLSFFLLLSGLSGA